MTRHVAWVWTFAVAWTFVTIAVAMTGSATAQNSQDRTATAHPDPLPGATKPLTPKSDASAHHKTSFDPPQRSASVGKTNLELTRLERQRIASTGAAKTVKNPSSSKPTHTSAGAGSGINFAYQKPSGGKAVPAQPGAVQKP